MDQELPWATRAAFGIGERIAYYRKQRKMSAQQLAARCAELGMPSVSRVVITKLENGRREVVSTAEVQVLAEALDVPPIQLLLPVGREKTAEVLPGRRMEMWDAVCWFSGHAPGRVEYTVVRAPGGGTEIKPPQDQGAAVTLLAQHAYLVDYIARLGDKIRASDEPERILIQEDHLRLIRATMRAGDMVAPDLPPGVAAAIGEEPGDGAR